MDADLSLLQPYEDLLDLRPRPKIYIQTSPQVETLSDDDELIANEVLGDFGHKPLSIFELETFEAIIEADRKALRFVRDEECWRRILPILLSLGEQLGHKPAKYLAINMLTRMSSKVPAQELSTAMLCIAIKYLEPEFQISHMNLDW